MISTGNNGSRKDDDDVCPEEVEEDVLATVRRPFLFLRFTSCGCLLPCRRLDCEVQASSLLAAADDEAI